VLVRMWRKGTPVHCWWKCKVAQSLWKTVWRFLKSYDAAIPLLGIYPKKIKVLTGREKLPHVHCIISSGQDTETTLSAY